MAVLLVRNPFIPRVSSDTSSVVALLLSKFGNKPFMKDEEQVYLLFVLHNAYDNVEYDFKRTVNSTPLNEVPDAANIIASHTIYNVKL